MFLTFHNYKWISWIYISEPETWRFIPQFHIMVFVFEAQTPSKVIKWWNFPKGVADRTLMQSLSSKLSSSRILLSVWSLSEASAQNSLASLFPLWLGSKVLRNSEGGKLEFGNRYWQSCHLTREDEWGDKEKRSTGEIQLGVWNQGKN